MLPPPSTVSALHPPRSGLPGDANASRARRETTLPAPTGTTAPGVEVPALQRLPNELQLKIARSLPLPDMHNFACVDRRTFALVKGSHEEIAAERDYADTLRAEITPDLSSVQLPGLVRRMTAFFTRPMPAGALTHADLPVEMLAAATGRNVFWWLWVERSELEEIGERLEFLQQHIAQNAPDEARTIGAIRLLQVEINLQLEARYDPANPPHPAMHEYRGGRQSADCMERLIAN